VNIYRDDTLAHLKASSIFTPYDGYLTVPMTQVVAATNKFLSQGGVRPVEKEAVQFYLLNHAMLSLEQKYHRHEVLPASALRLVEKFKNAFADLFLRQAFYTLIVITRESRHAGTTSKLKGLLDKEHPGYYPWLSGIPHSSQEAANYLLTSPPDLSWGSYLRCVSKVFHHGHFSSGFGGKAWGKIADALLVMVSGKASPLAFVDTAFTLAHNNGPMYNKGVLFTMSSASTLIKVLDVQRAGFVPQWLYGLHTKVERPFEPYPENFQILHELLDEVPTLAGHVDWPAVSKHSVAKTYYEDNEYQKHAMSYGPKPYVTPPKPTNRVWVTNNEFAVVVDHKRKAA
jgi:hypothetical protein